MIDQRGLLVWVIRGVLSLLADRGHTHISSMFHEVDRRPVAEDAISVANGIIGAYPNAFLGIERRAVRLSPAYDGPGSGYARLQSAGESLSPVAWMRNARTSVSIHKVPRQPPSPHPSTSRMIDQRGFGVFAPSPSTQCS
ncbi:MAG: fatty acid cis/trans isomerase [Gammaproteobacteria bacterium]